MNYKVEPAAKVKYVQNGKVSFLSEPIQNEDYIWGIYVSKIEGQIEIIRTRGLYQNRNIQFVQPLRTVNA